MTAFRHRLRENAWDHWRKAMAWKSSSQMTVLRDFLASIEWWRLEPAHQVVINVADSNQERAVFASAADRSWIDPVSGARHGIPGRLPNRGAHEFPAPDSGDDWALLLTRLSK